SYALKTLERTFEAGKTWRTPNGSYFAAKPLGKDAEVTFVYPGSSNAYQGLGQELFSLFPNLYDWFEEQVPNVESMLFSRKLYGGRETVDEQIRTDVLVKRLYKTELDAIGAMAVGVSFSAIYTHILQSYFGVKPKKVMGYSMGETSTMWYAMGVWKADKVMEYVHDSPIFQRRLAGKMETL
ncbi:MAG: hypothetical protein ACPGVB_17680, partial [Chitinophagales bacterium]